MVEGTGVRRNCMIYPEDSEELRKFMAEWQVKWDEGWFRNVGWHGGMDDVSQLSNTEDQRCTTNPFVPIGGESKPPCVVPTVAETPGPR
mgnify:CR=1 FL=1